MNIDKLKRRLAKVQTVLDTVRHREYELTPGTMRRAKASRNYDYYAQEKMKLKQQIEELENGTQTN